MKNLMQTKVNDYINILSQKYLISELINENEVKKLLEVYKYSNVNMSNSFMEKAISCIYMLKIYGIPLKATCSYFEINHSKVYKLLRLIGKSSLNYYDLFVNFLLRKEDEGFKSLFLSKLQSLERSYLNIISLYNMMKKDIHGEYFLFKENNFGYSYIAMRRHIKILKNGA